MWSSNVTPSAPANVHLAEILELLGPRREALGRVTNDLELEVTLQVSFKDSSGLTFSPTNMADLAKCHVGLWLDLYSLG